MEVVALVPNTAQTYYCGLMVMAVCEKLINITLCVEQFDHKFVSVPTYRISQEAPPTLKAGSHM